MKISILIPIYNAEKFLNKCLVSVLKQVEKNDEIILINDGSTDSSFDICKNIKKIYKDINIILINKKNEGVAVARNTGLKLATGDYIFWIDSDDWLHEECIKKVKSIIRKTKSDIILFDFYSVNKNSITPHFILEKGQSSKLDKHEVLVEVAQDSFSSFLWRTVAKRNLYKDVYFPEGIQMMEDFFIYHELFHKANTFFYIKEPLYYYRLVDNSLSQRKKNIMSMYNISLQREEFFRKNYPEIEEKYRLVPFLSASCLGISSFILNKERYNPQKYIRKYLYFLLTRRYFNLNKKIQFILMCISNKLLKVMRKAYEIVLDIKN